MVRARCLGPLLTSNWTNLKTSGDDEGGGPRICQDVLRPMDRAWAVHLAPALSEDANCNAAATGSNENRPTLGIAAQRQDKTSLNVRSWRMV